MKVVIVETKVTKHEFDTDKWGGQFKNKSKEEVIEHLDTASKEIGFIDVSAGAETSVMDWHFNIDSQEGESFYAD